MKAIMLDAVLLFPRVGYGVDPSILGHSRVKGRFPYSNERRLWREFLKKAHSADICRIMSGSGGHHALHLRQHFRRDDDRPTIDAPVNSLKDYGGERREGL